MESRFLRLLLLAVSIELFAVVAVISAFVLIPVLAPLVGLTVGVIGLVVALRGYFSRE